MSGSPNTRIVCASASPESTDSDLRLGAPGDEGRVLEARFAIGDLGALEVGAGVGTGMALVGNVAEGEIADFTVIGDVVNTTARLQGAAAAGEVLVTEETYAWVVDQFPDAPAKDLTLKGKAEPVAARVLLAAGASGPTVRNRHPDVGRS